MFTDHELDPASPAAADHDIAIIGLACRFALANNQQEYWLSLKHGRDHIHALSEQRQRRGNAYLRAKGFAPDAQAYYEGGFLQEIAAFDHEFFGISAQEATLMSPDQRLLLETAWSAIEDAGYGGGKLTSSKTGIFLGHSTDFGVRYKDIVETLQPTLASMAITGNIHSIIASRIAYLLDLKGPSMVIDTACSSALVAIHVACRSIRNGECEQALVGSVKIDPLPLNSIKQREDEIGITSADGRARAFDDSSGGTGLGEGVGVLLLKPLARALAEGDQIYAVIKGSAANQDGNSIGLTAPNPAAQEDVIRQAWQDAGIAPDTISYIEAHGTGTKLGDPIEVRGIERAFRGYTDRKQFCGIGSVKTNLGHLDHAAGLAGLIKAVLALKHRELPPSLHLRQPNRAIDFIDSPVYVNDRLRPWRDGGMPLRCGVSAFGLSGTNCHVVLEEAPASGTAYDRAAQPRLYVLMLSAKTREGLLALAGDYQLWLHQHPHSNPYDLCYTAQTGRGQYEARLAIIFADLDDLARRLEQVALGGLSEDHHPHIFYGEHRIISEKQLARTALEITQAQRSQLTSEAAGWLQQLIASGQTDDEAMLAQLCSYCVRGADIQWQQLYREQPGRHIGLPAYPFQPKICWVEAAEPLNERRWSVQDDLGHPLLDACLADSFDRVTYQSWFSGERQWLVREHQVAGAQVVPGTAYLEMILALVKRHYPASSVAINDVIFLSPMQIPFTETREVQTILRRETDTLDVVIASRSAEGGAWTKHVQGQIELRSSHRPATFDLAQLKTLCAGGTLPFFPYAAGSEIATGPHWACLRETFTGPGQILAHLELDAAFAAELNDYQLHPALLDEAVNIALRNIGPSLYLPFSYKSLTVFGQLPQRVYSYIILKNEDVGRELATFDIHLLDEMGHELVYIKQYSVKKIDPAALYVDHIADRQRYYRLVWQPQALSAVTDPHPGSTIVLHRADDLSNRLVAALRQQHSHLIEVNLDNRLHPEELSAASSLREDARIFAHLDDQPVRQIIDLRALSQPGIHVLADLERCVQNGLFALYHLVRQLMARALPQPIDLVVVSRYAFEVNSAEPDVYPHNAALFGLADVVRHEYPRLHCRCIDLDQATELTAIIDELAASGASPLVAYRQGQRYISHLDDLDITRVADTKIAIKEQGTYLITGGTGGIGLEVARWLAARFAGTIILINRTPFPAPETWSAILATSSDEQLRAKVALLSNIAASGTQVRCYAANSASLTQMTAVVDEIHASFGDIHGIFHCAGVAGDGFIIRRDEDAFNRVVTPKIQGTWILDQLTSHDPLDFLILFSSVSALLAEAGQGDYTAANRYLDSFAVWRNRQGRRTITINWPTWEDTGMAVEYGVDMQRQLFGTIHTPDAMAALELILRKDLSQVILGKPDFDVGMIQDAGLSFEISEQVYRRAMHSPPLASTRARKNPSAAPTSGFVLKGKATPEQYTQLERTIGAIYCRALGLEEVNIYDSFFDLGGNSILAVKIEIDLEQHDLPIMISDLYTYKSVADLAGFLERRSASASAQTHRSTAGQALAPLMDDRHIMRSTQQADQVILDNIIPFNTVFYKTCFHNSLFPVVNHFNRSITPFAANDLFMYAINSSDPLLDAPIRNVTRKTIPVLLQEIGIHMVARAHTTAQPQEFTPTAEDIKLLDLFSSHVDACEIRSRSDISSIIDDIISALVDHRPVIIWVDCFYESPRKDTFQKEHWMHTLLLYGYDDHARMFYAIEHTYRDNLTYRELQISYDDIFNAYQGFVSNYQPYTRMPTFYEFYTDNDHLHTSSYRYVFTTNIRDHQHEIDQGLEGLFSLIHSISRNILHETELQQHSDTIIKTLNAIVAAKQIEYHNMQLLLADHNVIDLLQKIVDSWTLIRQVLIKYKYSQIYNHKKLLEIDQQLKLLAVLEQNYYTELFSVVSELEAKRV